MNDQVFQEEQNILLRRMETELSPLDLWPDGCYGSRIAWLTFVGPSPGGRERTVSIFQQREHTQSPLWNADFTEPCEEWSPGFRNSTQTLVETILGRTKEQGALKLYNFTNFDWRQNPNAGNVPDESMQQGVKIVMKHLNIVLPRVILTMEKKSHKLLTKSLSQFYAFRYPQFDTVKLLASNTRLGPRFHRQIEAYQINGAGPLNNKFVLRCPQHPAHIFNKEYADRVARTLSHVLLCLVNHLEPISVLEP